LLIEEGSFRAAFFLNHDLGKSSRVHEFQSSQVGLKLQLTMKLVNTGTLKLFLCTKLHCYYEAFVASHSSTPCPLLCNVANSYNACLIT